MIKIAVCDDEKYYADQISQEIQKHGRKMGLKLSVDVYYDAAGFFEGPIESYQILFLDVKLQNGESGIELGKKLREKSSRAIIIYVSAYIEMAPMGYEVEAFRYLLKKDIEKTLAYTLEDAIAKLHKQNYNYVIRTKGKTQTLPLDEILYFESYKRYVTIYTSHENYKQYRKISDLEQELLEYGFGRIYKSYLVNWKHVQTIENGKALMDNGIRLTCSRTNYQEIIRQYILWVGRES
ncbi:MAG TPA: LytTR family DNA-binding domain-containing protein [Candidatus Blautia pullistercoris]|uniref:Stage 0 sporulation protein A homolog n=1 Tax=Candidatus Blautia pullistercoris TaxID=2838499 RepID=A0A9D1VLQ6_9FIRM|nr:LytTR family DNA-binding domain-containing protein [Candidatus Blautia pullistercoris]